jgi:hypothetical protein
LVNLTPCPLSHKERGNPETPLSSRERGARGEVPASTLITGNTRYTAGKSRDERR